MIAQTAGMAIPFRVAATRKLGKFANGNSGRRPLTTVYGLLERTAP
jgi:hypothetical protein